MCISLSLIVKNYICTLCHLKVQACEYLMESDSKCGYSPVLATVSRLPRHYLQAHCSRLTVELIPWYRVFLEQLVIMQLVEKFPVIINPVGSSPCLQSLPVNLFRAKTFCDNLYCTCFHGKELSTPCQTPKLEGHSLSAAPYLRTRESHNLAELKILHQTYTIVYDID
jgi:hypothetical protein